MVLHEHKIYLEQELYEILKKDAFINNIPISRVISCALMEKYSQKKMGLSDAEKEILKKLINRQKMLKIMQKKKENNRHSYIITNILKSMKVKSYTQLSCGLSHDMSFIRKQIEYAKEMIECVNDKETRENLQDSLKLLKKYSDEDYVKSNLFTQKELLDYGRKEEKRIKKSLRRTE